MKHYKILVLVLIAIFLYVPLASANEVSTTKDGTVSIKADAEHLKILNELRGTEISLGELIEKVFPEALKDTPKDILENQYKTPYNWDAESQSEAQRSALCSANSFLGSSFNPLEFSSNTIGIPTSFDTLDYMSVLSWLEYHPIGSSDISIKASEYDYDYDTLYVNASGDWDGFSYGGYRTHGTHYCEDIESVPSVVTEQTFTDWMYLMGK